MKGYCQICMVENIELAFLCPICSTGRCEDCNDIIKNKRVTRCLNSLCESDIKKEEKSLQEMRAFFPLPIDLTREESYENPVNQVQRRVANRNQVPLSSTKKGLAFALILLVFISSVIILGILNINLPESSIITDDEKPDPLPIIRPNKTELLLLNHTSESITDWEHFPPNISTEYIFTRWYELEPVEYTVGIPTFLYEMGWDWFSNESVEYFNIQLDIYDNRSNVLKFTGINMTVFDGQNLYEEMYGIWEHKAHFQIDPLILHQEAFVYKITIRLTDELFDFLGISKYTFVLSSRAYLILE